MSVAQEYRNLGVGRALLKILLNWAKDNPIIEKVYLEVFAKNTAAIALYKKSGFIEEGRKVKGVKIDQQTYDDILLMAQFVEKGTT
ncbi:N-acetyltransferase [Caldifermentibacillus hisashii]